MLEKNLYIVPVYLSGGLESEWELDYCMLYDFLFSFDDTENMIIVGDLNGRVGEGQSLPTQVAFDNTGIEYERRSKDTVINKKGRKLINLCEEFNFVILNGRVTGDESGEFTFVNNRGASVIDLCCVSLDSLHLIEYFEVKGANFSDHFPISISIKCESIAEVEKSCSVPLAPKLTWNSANGNSFVDKLAERCRNVSHLPEDIDEACTLLKELIYDTTNFKNEPKLVNNKFKKSIWYDRECEMARNTMFALLKLFRKNNSIVVKNDYLAAVKDYKEICKRKKDVYWEGVKTKLKSVRDSKHFWELVREFKGKNEVRKIDIKPEEWVCHFKELYTPIRVCGPTSYAEPHITDELLDKALDINEIRLSLKKLRNGKAPGEDRICGEFYKKAPVTYIQLMIILFNRIFDVGKAPESFKKSIVFPLHKKGDTRDPKNYRAISFTNSIYKVFVGCLLNRLEQWVTQRKIIRENQAGFRKGYSSVDNIYVLYNLIRYHMLVRNKKVYCFFVDFKAAFDSIDREALFYRLLEIGISNKFVRVLRALYEKVTSAVWCKNGNGLTESIEFESGLKQGCLVSPILFSIFTHDICEYIGGGLRMGDTEINALLYADDLVIFTDSIHKMQRMINKLRDYCCRWNLILNRDKSKIIVFRKGGRLSRSSKRVQVPWSHFHFYVIFD
ncbi:uncharacterized protein LOC120355972 [Nilaparvata lugens]|uniref:uncharacterized protein LOC120355972 n=1 Tax=Nilaparvata lugens TaxID=108931 RepID=UPI00193D4E39|nr:uncharacterized protein LOC120355972 [Nilaparvata lugens]